MEAIIVQRPFLYALTFGILCVGVVKLLDTGILEAISERVEAERTELADSEEYSARNTARQNEPAYGAAFASDDVRLTKARNGHFYADLEVNRSKIHVLIDTGASMLALRDSDARRAGLYPKPSDYKYRVNTANGQTYAARMTAREIDLERITLRNQTVYILPDDKLDISLLGMSILSQMGTIEMNGANLIIHSNR